MILIATSPLRIHAYLLLPVLGLPGDRCARAAVMKQTTLGTLGKRTRETDGTAVSPNKRGAGGSKQAGSSSSQPIELDGVQGSIIDVDAQSEEEEEEANKTADVPEPHLGGDETTALHVTRLSKHGGPTNSDPCRINEPPFDVRSTFTHVQPKVIKKDPELDLLYFKTFSAWRLL